MKEELFPVKWTGLKERIMAITSAAAIHWAPRVGQAPAVGNMRVRVMFWSSNNANETELALLPIQTYVRQLV